MKLTRLLAIAVALGALSHSNVNAAAHEEGESAFSTPTIDIGVVVKDLERSVEFYTKAIGFKKVSQFDVPAATATDAGLTRDKSLSIDVLKLGEGEGATSLKLMTLPEVKSKEANNNFIHSQFGFSYITIHVKDTKAAMERLEKVNIKPIAKGPVELPESLGAGVFLTVLKDPDGNFVELVGPSSE